MGRREGVQAQRIEGEGGLNSTLNGASGREFKQNAQLGGRFKLTDE